MAEKWIGKINLKEGRFTNWCKAHGFSGPTRACIEVAKKSKNKSVIGMATFAERSKRPGGF